MKKSSWIWHVPKNGTEEWRDLSVWSQKEKKLNIKRLCDKLRIERYGRTSHDFFNFQRLQLSLLWLKMPLGCITCCAFLQARLLSSVVGEKNHVSLYLSIIKKKKQITGTSTLTQCLKITQNVSFEFSNLAFFTKFWPIKSDLSGNTVWPWASGFQKFAKMDHFWHS